MLPNFYTILACGLIPFLVAFIWYHPKVFGGDNWQKIVGLTDEQTAIKVSPFKLFLSILLNVLIAFGLYLVCVHQSGILGILAGDFEAVSSGTAKAFMDEYGTNELGFAHGMFHGLMSGTIAFVLPVLGYVVIFERKSAKYFWVNIGFWAISLMLMGGVIGEWGWQLI